MNTACQSPRIQYISLNRIWFETSLVIEKPMSHLMLHIVLSFSATKMELLS